MFESLGSGFTLLALGADKASVREFEVRAAAAEVPLTVLRDSLEDGREAYGARLVLARPDQFVAWTGEVAPADVRTLLDRVTGRT